MLLVKRRLSGRTGSRLASTRLVLVAIVTVTLVLASVSGVAFVVLAYMIAFTPIAVPVSITITVELGAPVQIVHVSVVAFLVASVDLPKRYGHIFAQKIVEILQNLDGPLQVA